MLGRTFAIFSKSFISVFLEVELITGSITSVKTIPKKIMAV
jgi:hypothetical protein